MIVDRYLLRAVLAPTLAILCALIVIFASYSATRYLAEAAQGGPIMGLVGAMIGLRVLVALEVLLPLALYLGVIVGLGRLYADQEMTAWQAGGLGRALMLRSLIGFALVVAGLVALLSVYGRPWAYGQLYALESAAETRLDLSAITPRRFYISDDAVLYAGAKSDDGRRLDDVFTRFVDATRSVVIRAAHMRRDTDADGAPTLAFDHGHLYQLDPDGSNDSVVGFGHLQWHLKPSSRVVGYKRKAATTADLFIPRDSDDVAERQWRLSRPLATFFLALLAISFARSSPRSGRALNVLAATMSFALYYGLASVARSWVEQRAVGALPGLYWVDALVGAIAMALLARRRGHY